METEPPHKALLMSFLVILVSEIGDKTFLIAAVMAMQHSRILVFSAAISALIVMTVLSVFMGQILPSLISKQYTDIAASVLFLIFGVKLLHDTLKLTGNEVVEELEEVTQELLVESAKKTEEGNTSQTGGKSVWIQVFVMTFLAEWGDRTVALSSSQNGLWVTVGGLLGHAICSGVAVMGGRLLATKISVRTVTMIGGVLFLIFGVFGLYTSVNEYS